jgi:hypothetical protein
MPVKRGQPTSARRTSRETRMTRPRLDCLKSNPDRNTRSPAAIADSVRRHRLPRVAWRRVANPNGEVPGGISRV